jgi:hypothetical protein
LSLLTAASNDAQVGKSLGRLGRALGRSTGDAQRRLRLTAGAGLVPVAQPPIEKISSPFAAGTLVCERGRRHARTGFAVAERSCRGRRIEESGGWGRSDGPTRDPLTADARLR